MTKAEIAACYDVPVRILRQWLKDEGLYPGRKRILSPKEVDKIILVFGPLDKDSLLDGE